MAAWFITHYDLEFTDEKYRTPRAVPIRYFGFFNLLDYSVKVTFRRRKGVH